MKKFKVYSTAERSLTRQVHKNVHICCVVHVYINQLSVGVRYLELVDCAWYLRSLGVASITLCVCMLGFLYLYSKTLETTGPLHFYVQNGTE